MILKSYEKAFGEKGFKPRLPSVGMQKSNQVDLLRRVPLGFK
jgi:hypothetical protein